MDLDIAAFFHRPLSTTLMLHCRLDSNQTLLLFLVVACATFITLSLKRIIVWAKDAWRLWTMKGRFLIILIFFTLLFNNSIFIVNITFMCLLVSSIWHYDLRVDLITVRWMVCVKTNRFSYHKSDIKKNLPFQQTPFRSGSSRSFLFNNWFFVPTTSEP